MENWYKPGPVRISYIEPDPRPKKPKRNWEKYSDIMDYQAKNVEKIRKHFVDYDGSGIKGKPWNDDEIDSINLALKNCFNSTFAAWLHITSVKRGIRHLADALRLTPPEPGKAGDADE